MALSINHPVIFIIEDRTLKGNSLKFTFGSEILTQIFGELFRRTISAQAQLLIVNNSNVVLAYHFTKRTYIA